MKEPAQTAQPTQGQEPKQSPSVGRIIHVYSSEEPTKLPAIITKVNNGEDITVTVFSVDGTTHRREHLKSNEWMWPARV